MFVEFDRPQLNALSEALHDDGIVCERGFGRGLLQQLFPDIDRDNVSSQHEWRWQLYWLARLDRLFLLSLPNAPGFIFAGGTFSIPDEAGRPVPYSVSGVGTSQANALRAAAGEIAEQMSLYAPDLRVLCRQRDAASGDANVELPEDWYRVLFRQLPADVGELPLVEAAFFPGCLAIRVPAILCCELPDHKGEFQRSAPLTEGCGAGLTLDAAIAQGAFELVERDAFSLWWHGGLPARKILFSDMGAKRFSRFRERIRGASPVRHDLLLDITTDNGIPAVAAISHDPDGRRVACGTAARPNYSLAVMAAFREMCQLEFGYDLTFQKLEQSGDRGLGEIDRSRLRQETRFNVETTPMFQASEASDGIDFVESDWATSDRAKALETLNEARLRFVSVNIGSPHAPLHVTKQLSPDLQSGSTKVITPRLQEVIKQTGGTEQFTDGATLV